VLIFAGDIKEKQAFELAEKTFGNWGAGGIQRQITLPEISEPNSTHIWLVDRPGSVQSEIRVGQLGITRSQQPEYFVSRIVSNYFGWGLDSRLNENLRIKKGLTYGAFGSYIANRFAGEFKVDTFSKTEKTAEAVKAVLDEIERLKLEGPSKKELNDRKSYMMGTFVVNGETPQQIANHLWLIESQQLGDDYLDRLLAEVAKTQTGDCLRLVENTIDISKMVIVVVGDAVKLKADLEKIAPVTVVKI